MPPPLPTLQPDLSALPLFAQALVAIRLARRAAMAMLDGEAKAAAEEACDRMEAVARDGDGWNSLKPPHEVVVGVGGVQKFKPGRGGQTAVDALRWSWDSLGAAQGANDFPVDHIVAASAARCIEAIASDPRVSRMQLGILLAADVDLLTFACGEARAQKYNGLSEQVLSRLTPCHPLTLSTPRPSPEEQMR